MDTISGVFFVSGAEINFLEQLNLPVILSPDKSIQVVEGQLDVFCILQGNAELMFNNSQGKSLNNNDVIILNRKANDYFVLSGARNNIIIHATITPNGIYKDLILCYGHKRIRTFNNSYPNYSTAAAELLKLMLRLKSDNIYENKNLEDAISVFFIKLFISGSNTIPFKLKNKESKLFKLMIKMIKNPARQWKVNTLAIQNGMSVNLFIKEFKKQSGYTPFNFLQKIRLNRGRQLLEQTDMHVSTIANECGYNSHASFTIYIKREFGKSPTQIRKDAQLISVRTVNI